MITDRDVQYLKQLKHCTVALHGYDHNFYCWTGTERDEFIDNTEDEINACLVKGLKILQDLTPVTMFIPPFNRIPQKLIPCLENNNITDITTGVNYNGHPYGPPVDFKSLTVWTPDEKFYGKSSDIRSNMTEFTKKDHIGLHLTWEIEELVAYNSKWALPDILNQLSKQL